MGGGEKTHASQDMGVRDLPDLIQTLFDSDSEQLSLTMRGMRPLVYRATASAARCTHSGSSYNLKYADKLHQKAQE